MRNVRVILIQLFVLVAVLYAGAVAAEDKPDIEYGKSGPSYKEKTATWLRQRLAVKKLPEPAGSP